MRAQLLILLTVLLGAPLCARADDLIVLLQARSCPNCKLADAVLVHADLHNAELTSADLKRANLSRARLVELTFQSRSTALKTEQGVPPLFQTLHGLKEWPHPHSHQAKLSAVS